MFLISTANKQVVTGARFPAEHFQCIELHGQVAPDAMRHLLHGSSVAVIIRGYVSRDDCATISANFQATAGAHQRPDDVQALEVGAGHYGKTLDGYFDQVDATGSALERLFQGALHVGEALTCDLQRAARPGMVVRRAMHGGRLAARLRAAQWQRAGAYSLSPHEDFSQLFQAAQLGWEAQHILNPVALNVYVSMPATGGELRIWNIAPDERTRTALGVEQRGHPYPLEALDGFGFFDIRIEPGDAVFNNGRFLHAVLEGEGDPRINLNGFAGIARDGASIIQYT